MEKEKAKLVTETLKKNYPDVKCALEHESAYELLVATVLSAQCTDVRVNKVTQVLFNIANTPEKMLALGHDGLLDIIKSCGLSESKTKNILSLSETLINDYSSQVPNDMQKLTSLAGVGRKTANVVLSNAFGVPAIAVDTHVFRVANRIGYACENDVFKTEKALMEAIDKNDWSVMHHVLIWHGRRICHARKPECSACCIKELCEFKDKNL